MTDVRIYHNPRCSKSREAMGVLGECDVQLDIVNYIDEPPSREELTELLEILEDEPADLVRTGDQRFKELGIDRASLTTKEAVIDLLVSEPALMQRPVVVSDGRAVIARPVTERITDLLG